MCIIIMMVGGLVGDQPLPNDAGCDHFHQCAHKLVRIQTQSSVQVSEHLIVAKLPGADKLETQQNM